MKRTLMLLVMAASCWLAPARAQPPVPGFHDCAAVCPEMIALPTGHFTMGSPPSELNRYADETRHPIVLGYAFAVGKYDVTFAQWDTCVADGGCGGYTPPDQDWGRANRPVVNVNLADALAYVAWLSRKTGKPYRLLSESEWEYAARGGTSGAYYWGDDIGVGNADCKGCGSHWDNDRSAPVGSFSANPFGLFDMAGNVWTWIADCWNITYTGAPADGSPWATGICSQRVLRGGAFDHGLGPLRAASRGGYDAAARDASIGFRVARTL